MIPDTLRRLSKAVEDLREFIATHQTESSLAGSQTLKNANEASSRHAASEEDVDGTGAEEEI